MIRGIGRAANPNIEVAVCPSYLAISAIDSDVRQSRCGMVEDFSRHPMENEVRVEETLVERFVKSY
jgi:hypothetical protein